MGGFNGRVKSEKRTVNRQKAALDGSNDCKAWKHLSLIRSKNAPQDKWEPIKKKTQFELSCLLCFHKICLKKQPFLFFLFLFYQFAGGTRETYEHNCWVWGLASKDAEWCSASQSRRQTHTPADEKKKRNKQQESQISEVTECAQSLQLAWSYAESTALTYRINCFGPQLWRARQICFHLLEARR